MAAKDLAQMYQASALPQDMPSEWQRAISSAMGMPPYESDIEHGHGHSHVRKGG